MHFYDQAVSASTKILVRAIYMYVVVQLLSDTLNSLSLQLTYTPPECSRLRYVCIRTTAGDGATYIDARPDNDVACADWTEFLLCQPRE